jgi:hypothetical protein
VRPSPEDIIAALHVLTKEVAGNVVEDEYVGGTLTTMHKLLDRLQAQLSSEVEIMRDEWFELADLLAQARSCVAPALVREIDSELRFPEPIWVRAIDVRASYERRRRVLARVVSDVFGPGGARADVAAQITDHLRRHVARHAIGATINPH